MTGLLRSIDALLVVPGDTRILISHDGLPQAATPAQATAFAGYREALTKALRARASRLTATEAIWSSGPSGGFGGTLQAALRHPLAAAADFVLVCAHDQPFVRAINMSAVLEDVRSSPQIKHLRFNKRSNAPAGWDRGPLFGTPLRARHYTYTRTPAWSADTFLSTPAYLERHVFARIERERLAAAEHRSRATAAELELRCVGPGSEDKEAWPEVASRCPRPRPRPCCTHVEAVRLRVGCSDLWR